MALGTKPRRSAYRIPAFATFPAAKSIPPIRTILSTARRQKHERNSDQSDRAETVNCHGFRIAVHRVTGEIVILQSVHAADAGVVVNPVQLRGQIEGANRA